MAQKTDAWPGVSFGASFWGRPRGERRGAEVRLDKAFTWAGERWRIPAVYVCGKGLVADFLLRVPPRRVRAFLRRYGPLAEQAETDEALCAELEDANPLAARLSAKAVWNGRALAPVRTCRACWAPFAGSDAPQELAALLAHYGCDPACGWAAVRAAFPWAAARHGALRTLAFELEDEAHDVYGPAFTVSGPGQTLAVRHPLTGETYTLTVTKWEPRCTHTIPDEQCEHPSCFAALHYTLDPQPQPGLLRVADCAPADASRPKNAGPYAPQARADFALALLAGPDAPGEEIAVSSLRFAHADTVTWRPCFSVRTKPPIHVHCAP